MILSGLKMKDSLEDEITNIQVSNNRVIASGAGATVGREDRFPFSSNRDQILFEKRVPSSSAPSSSKWSYSELRETNQFTNRMTLKCLEIVLLLRSSNHIVINFYRTLSKDSVIQLRYRFS